MDNILGNSELSQFSNTQEIIGEARNAMYMGDYEKSGSLFLAVLKKDLNNREALQGLAELSVKMGRQEESEKIYEKLRSLDAAGSGFSGRKSEEQAQVNKISIYGESGNLSQRKVPDVSAPRYSRNITARAEASPPSFLDIAGQGETNKWKEGRLVLDLDIGLENSLLYLVVISVIAGIILFTAGGGKLTVWIAVPVTVAILSLVVRTGVDNYYFLDSKDRMLCYRRKIFSYEEIVPLAKFQEIALTTTTGRKMSSKHSTWWEYAAILIYSNAKIIRVSNFMREDFGAANSIAESAASYMEIPYQNGVPETYTVARKDSSTGQIAPFYYSGFEYWIHDLKTSPLKQVAYLILALAVLGFIIYLTRI